MTALSVVCVGVLLTVSPLAHTLGFTPLPGKFYAMLAGFVMLYLLLVELVKRFFYAEPIRLFGEPHRTRGMEHRIHRRAARFSHNGGVAQAARPSSA